MGSVAGADSWDRFILREVVGSGGMGSVHRAIDRLTGDTVALKTMLTDSPALRDRFAIEREALASLDHPGIVRLVAHGEMLDGRLFLAMEWLDGEDLSARLARGLLTPHETAVLGARAASVLSAAHDRGVIHRDIKPGNLFLLGGRADRVKVLDFGIARIAGRAVTPVGTVLGTPWYIAPEQALEGRDVDARADLFSLGAVMFECLTGSPPFSGEHVMAVLAKVLLEEAPRLRDLCPEAPAALTSLVDRLLAKDPSARPESAGVVAAALTSLAAEMEANGAKEVAAPTLLAPPSLPVRERRFITVVAMRSDAALTAGVESLGGRVDQLANGTTLVTWMGAEDPAERTARAARFALRARAIAPSSTIAVATALSDGVDLRPIGQALDRVASLLAHDERSLLPGIRLDPAAAGLLDPRFQITQGSFGFELLGEEEISRGARTLLGRPSPFAGRDRELRMLLDLVEECARERAARAALVTAPAGVGKSRLAHELRLALAARRLEALDVWLGRGDCMSAGSAFAAIGSALRNTARIRIGDPLSERQRNLAERVARHVPAPERARVTAFLGELAGVPFPEAYCALLGPARHNAAAMAERIRRAWEDFVAAECAAHPVMLVVDDLHWGDAPTVNLLDATLDALRDGPLFVLALGRPETHDMFPGLWERREVQEIRLGGLSPRAAEGLVRAMLGASIDGELAARIVERAAGNAFYLEEMIRAAAEGGLRELPATVLATVQARLDVLSGEERAVLRAATVFGEVFWLAGVEALLEGTDLAARAAACLNALVSREILVASASSRYPGERELAFRHALLRDGAYALVSEPDRAAAHRLAAEWLEEMGEDDAVLLAEHYEQGRVPERAVVHRLIAAERALAGNDLRSAIAHAERSTPASGDREILLRRAHLLNESYWITGDSERAKGSAAELLALSPVGSETWCNAIGVQMLLDLESCSVERLYATIETFLGAPVANQRSEWIARVYGLIALALTITGLRGPTAYFLEMAEKTAESDPPDPTTYWFLWTARAQWSFFIEGDFLAAIDAHQRALDCCEQSGRRQFDAFNHGLLSWVYIMLGALDRAEEHARRALRSSHPGGLAGLMGQVSLSWLSTARGALEEGIAFAKGAFEAAPSDAYMAGMAKTAWGFALSSAGRWQEAEPHAREALQYLAATPALHALARVQQCSMRLSRGHPAEALRDLLPELVREGSFVAHPMALSYARMVRIEVLEALRDQRALDAALLEERDRILASAARIDDPSLRASFLEFPPWNTLILAKAAERLPGRPHELGGPLPFHE